MAGILKSLAHRFRVLLIPLSFSLIFVAVFPFAWEASMRQEVSEVETPTPGWLPVLVFTQGDVEVVWHEELAQYTKVHPDYSFLAPDVQDDELNRRLVASYRKKVPNGDSFPRFEVKRLTPEKQSLELGFQGDRELVVWYEATDKEIFPRRYMMAGLLFPFIPLFWSGVVSAVACGMAYGLWRLYREARSAKA